MKKVLTLALLTLALSASSLAAQLGSLLDIEGIGPATVDKLTQAGVGTPQALLDAGATKKGRAELSQKTGISTSQLLKWVNRVDLSRVKGIGPQYADLLEAAGVDTPKELASRNPDHLVETLTRTNNERHLVRQVPSASQVGTWITSAKKLKPIVQY
jgi:predicted flap endonuclease-1-like 5' DNA nuclease